LVQQLIVNADDFGRSSEINAAVILAHREGILTSASLMVAGDAAEEAAALAKQNPTLAVGLHVVAVDGPAVLPASRIPFLVDDSGRFPDAPVRLGLRYFFRAAARRQLAAELAAQFERFAALGLSLSHVDGHQHMHMHPAVFKMLLPLATRYGARGIRIVRDDLRLALEHDGSRRVAKIMSAAVFALLRRSSRRRFSGTALHSLCRTYGFFQTGQMDKSYVLSLLKTAREPMAEIYFHPTTGPRLDRLGPNPVDLDTLLSPAVREAVAARDWELCNYPQIARQ